MQAANYLEEALQATPQAGGLLFHALKDGNSAYHIGVACRLRATASVEQIHAAWHRIQLAQPALRSVFAWRGLRHPHQLIHAAPRIALDYAATTLAADAGEVGPRCLAWLANSRATPFALNREVFRIACFHDAETGVLDLAFSFHHILMDGWSSSLLISQWVQGLRGQLLTGLDARQYAQQLWQGLDPQSQEHSRHYWEAAFAKLGEAGAAPATLLLAEPLFRPDSAADQPAQPLRIGRQWERDRKQAVEALCRQAGVTPASFFYLCWALMLARFTYRRQVVFGCAFSGREAALAHDADRQPLGLFTNTVPLAVALDGGWSVAAALQAVFQTLLQTQKHEKTPPLTVREAAGQRGELYDSLVVFDNYPIDAGLQDARQGVSVQALHSEETTHFGLTLTVSGLEDWRVELMSGEQYRGRPEAIEAVLAAFEAQATDLLALPTAATIGSLSLKLAPAAAPTLPVAGRVNTQLPDINAVLAGIRQGLLQTPDAIGLVDGERPVRKRELVDGIGAIQARLRQAGFVAGDRVAIHMDKGLLSTQAILAIVFGGGSYVYLNPKDPLPRKQSLLTLAGCGIVLDAASLQLDPATFSGRHLLLDTTVDAAPGAAELVLWPHRRPADEFYFIFTSGTTGTPKGISIRNESVANLLDWFVRDCGLSAGDRVLGLTDLNFDPSVEDLFGSLAAGATLIYPPARVLQEKAAFIALMQREAVSLVNFIPGAIAELIQGAPRLPAMRLWIFGGEELPRRLRDELLAQGYAVRNHYGPSETTVDCLCAPQVAGQPVAIGWPVQNTLAYCADAFGQPLPAGIRGELRVGGVPVALGYTTHAAETTHCFVEHGGHRFYRTGDAVVFSPELGFSYLGRLDDQAKVNGVRIEPRELERVVELLAEVRTASLLPATTSEGKRQWQLFVDSATQSELLLPRLREHIRGHLPETWLPARMLVLDGLARTVTGKIDRQRLLALAAQATLPAADAAPLVDPIAAKVQAVWREVLDGAVVVGDVNFFDAGGNSLKIIALQSQLQAAFGREIGVTVLFEHPTIAAFADWLRRSETAADSHPDAQPDPASTSREQQLSSARTGKSRLDMRRQKAKESSVT
ncbi:AMP-binding protein [Chitinimonas arctica]|uniref:AMP-binding protein n=1 Tax=Chitinimonas arctica TaxID=2594795 RepID=A0A516SL44_9NEIS|nr:AMP-binding protein [Chitinimonas arctica]QDQ28738.1 AMP-binding protein [Chitinimonas arctica]